MNIKFSTFPSTQPVPLCLWSTRVDNYQTINADILSVIADVKLKNPEGFTDSINFNTWQSKWNMETYPGFKEIAEIACNVTAEIAQDHFKCTNFSPKILDCWANVYDNQGGCNQHSHFPATFALVYYVQVPPGSGDIYFPEAEIKLTPVVGHLLCFSGATWHGVDPSQTDENRIAIGINIGCN
jgi:hypothetical protein